MRQESGEAYSFAREIRTADEGNERPYKPGSAGRSRASRGRGRSRLLEAFDRAVALLPPDDFASRSTAHVARGNRGAGGDDRRRARDDREARAGHQEGDFAGKSHRHFSRQSGARHRADRGRRRGLLLQCRPAGQPREAAERHARFGERSLRDRRRSRLRNGGAGDENRGGDRRPIALRVGSEHGTQSLVLQRSAQLAKASL